MLLRRYGSRGRTSDCQFVRRTRQNGVRISASSEGSGRSPAGEKWPQPGYDRPSHPAGQLKSFYLLPG